LTDPEAWLAERLEQAPPSLRARMTEALTEDAPSEADLGIALQAAGERLLRLAQSGPPNHDTGLTLLAADALVTLACEWDARPRG
jgi:hypothetical protein